MRHSLVVDEEHLPLLPQDIRLALLHNRVIFKGLTGELATEILNTVEESCSNLYWTDMLNDEALFRDDDIYAIMFSTKEDRVKFQLAMKDIPSK